MFNKSHIVLASSLLLLIALPVIRADLMCYVCDDCAQLPKDAPLLACNEDFFNPGGSTEASTVTTTTTTTEASTTPTEETTAAPVETTTAITSVETDPPTTESSTTSVESTVTSEATTESTQSTEAPIPTPPTVGPVQTTTGVPTPPTEDLAALSVALNTTRLVPVDADAAAETTTPIPTPLAIRQRRAVVTYHCYSVQVTVNGTMTTDRGCSRVTTMEGVCEQLKIQNNNTELANCDPCSMNACNGGSTLQNSVLASLLLALVAFALQRN
ncbi:flocculation protein FLO11 [Drosophila subpulchrella]|uniref:flocculation protein FLO11 n=1 Tax=Drosophila subpulchrella TaxID=1486046 RepID=UPI0018A16084|nr:flocculation protein FLO11 [Drosophila subpulchrella]